MKRKHSVIIIGAGAAGIGFGTALKQLGISSFAILEQGCIGESFQNWPKETRFITPSFTSNGFGMPDLNAITPLTSPAYTLGKERLSGDDFSLYLEAVTSEYQLPIYENTKVLDIKKQDDHYLITSAEDTWEAKYVIFAVGEFNFPSYSEVNGSEHGIHYGNVGSWSNYEGTSFSVIGGNESAIDAAIHLSETGKNVTLYTKSTGIHKESADPSIRLSPYTRERLMNAIDKGNKLTIKEKHTLTDILQTDEGYLLKFKEGGSFFTSTQPFLCTGFNTGITSIGQSLFQLTKDLIISLTDNDESTLSSNAFIIGPSVHHGEAILCYIYKFRQRFAYIIDIIANREGWKINGDILLEYKNNNMYLDDCTSCAVTCSC